jgi:hypothetical protein
MVAGGGRLILTKSDPRLAAASGEGRIAGRAGWVTALSELDTDSDRGINGTPSNRADGKAEWIKQFVA